MNAHEYFRHIRSLGPFRAIEAFALAKEAARMDEESKITTPPAVVAYETLHDGSCPVRLSFGIKVY